MKTKVFCFILFALLIATLAGCGNSVSKDVINSMSSGEIEPSSSSYTSSHSTTNDVLDGTFWVCEETSSDGYSHRQYYVFDDGFYFEYSATYWAGTNLASSGRYTYSDEDNQLYFYDILYAERSRTYVTTVITYARDYVMTTGLGDSVWVDCIIENNKMIITYSNSTKSYIFTKTDRIF